MKEKILAALQTKFQGVDVATLTRIAEKKAVGVTDENMITSIIEGITFQDVLTNYGDFRANGASNTAVENYEKKHKIKDGKPVEEPKPTPKNEPKPNEDVPAWAQALIESNKTLSEKLTGFEEERAKQTRSAMISAKAKEYGIPESLVKMLGIPDDADLDTFMKDAKQEFANLGFEGVVPPEGGSGKPENRGEAIANLIRKGTEEIVEQKS